MTETITLIAAKGAPLPPCFDCAVKPTQVTGVPGETGRTVLTFQPCGHHHDSPGNVILRTWAWLYPELVQQPS